MANDELGFISFYGHDGAGLYRSAYIAGHVDGTPASGTHTVQGRLEFYTTGTGQNDSTERMRIDSSGQVGIGTTSAAATLDVKGTIKSVATTNSGTTIDFSTGNLQYTSSSCTAMTLNNMKSGATYTLAVQGAAGGTCAFTPYTGVATGALTLKAGPAGLVQSANKHTLFTFLVMGSYVYVASIDGY